MSLHIPKADYQLLQQHAEEAYSDECCGVLLGQRAADTRHVHAIARCQNIRVGDAQKRFEIDPAELVRAQRQARESGLEIVGFYHSHPDHPARPSPTDLVHAHWIGCSYVITSVVHGKAHETRSFLLGGTLEEDKNFAQEDILIE